MLCVHASGGLRSFPCGRLMGSSGLAPEISPRWKGRDPARTQPAVLLVGVPFPLLPAAAAEPHADDVEVAEDDHRRREDRPVVEGHDQLVALEFPHLVGYGLHLEEGVALKRTQFSLAMLLFVVITGAVSHLTPKWEDAETALSASSC